MADDPLRAVLAQWRQVQETGASTASSAAPPQLRTRRATPSYPQPHPPPPTSSSAAASAPRASTRQPGPTYALPSTGRAALATQPPPFGSVRTRQYGYTHDERKGASDAADPLARDFSRKGPTQNYQYNAQRVPPQPPLTQAPPPPRRTLTATATTTTTSTREAEREAQREKQKQLARMMDQQRTSVAATPASSGAAYYELESPARPMENGGAGGYHGNQADDAQDDTTTAAYGNVPPPRHARRVSPSDVMQELDDDFRRSFNEHQHASETMSRDAVERSTESLDQDDDGEDQEDGDTFDGRANGYRGGYARRASPPPPVVEVRVQHVHPPFREELSSDLSDHAPSAAFRTPPHSTEHGTLSDDPGGAHFPMSGAFDSIPSISLTPPASPAHRHQARNTTTAGPLPQVAEQRGRAVSSPKEVVFPTWSIGFLAGCVVVGLGGLFMDELMQFTGVFVTPSPFTLSRIEQREMNRRLDLLQQELRSFRVAATEIEQQSQRMVHEVRAHLEKMKSERERHQQMISREMEALRRYVQAVTNELVEDEKKEIRKRLLETIADTIVELPDDLDETGEDVVASVVESETKVSRRDASQSTPTDAKPSVHGGNKGNRQKTHERVEIAISAVESEAAALLQHVDEATVRQQIDRAVASGPETISSPKLPSNASAAIQAARTVDTGASLFPFEWLVLLAGVALIAGVVGFRVRNSHKRKTIYRARKPSVFLHPFGAKNKTAPASTDESDVETVSFFRSDHEGDGDDTDHRSTGPSDGEGFSEDYSEEEKEGDYESTGGYEENASMASDRDDYEFHEAASGGDVSTHSDVESLDESSSTSVDPPTPFPRVQQQLKDRLADESPTVRRSPRVQTARSHLFHMR